MKYILSFALCVCVIKIANGQNIVPNPNFAEKIACPDDYSQTYKCRYWYQPTNGSSDYFNICHDSLAGSSHTMGVPYNAGGYQQSTSNAYLGFYTYVYSTDVREYVATDIPALTVGKTYRVTVTTSLSENSYYATDGLGVFFCSNIDPLWTTVNGPTGSVPQINYDAMGVISDMVNWVTLTDTFTADSAYSHLVIGNFKTNAELNKTVVGAGTMAAYYYIDSVAVEEIKGLSVVSENGHTGIAHLSPNPVKDKAILDVKGATVKDGILNIYNAQGSPVREVRNINSQQVTIYREDLAKGFYYYQLQAANGLTIMGKMVLE